MSRTARIVGSALIGLLVMSAYTPASATGSQEVVHCRTANPDCWPVTFAFAPGSRIFYVERFTGQIRAFNRKKSRDRRWATVGHLSTNGEQGLLGIALDPRWRRARRFRWVYVYYTHDDPFQNRVMRLRKRHGAVERQVLTTIPAAGNHNGGVIGFGPGGKLFVLTGDASDPANAQNLGTHAGKVLRMNKNGTVPSDNPFAGSRVFSYGHRNSFGFTIDPFTRKPWQTENGPQCNDEVNVLFPGRNYGWGPSQACPNTNQDGPSPFGPAYVVDPPEALTGAAFCKGCGLTGLEGKLVFGAFNNGVIRSATLTANRVGIASVATLYDHGSFVLGMRRSRAGRLFFSDSRFIYRLVN